jgi:hypothetical protein
MRCSLKNKSKTKHKKRGRLLIHIPGVWPNPSQETSNVHEYRERLRVLRRNPLRPSFGMFCKQQTLYFTLENHTGTSTEALNILP